MIYKNLNKDLIILIILRTTLAKDLCLAIIFIQMTVINFVKLTMFKLIMILTYIYIFILKIYYIFNY